MWGVKGILHYKCQDHGEVHEDDEVDDGDNDDDDDDDDDEDDDDDDDRDGDSDDDNDEDEEEEDDDVEDTSWPPTRFGKRRRSLYDRKLRKDQGRKGPWIQLA